MAESVFGRELTELFFARYTRVMWGLTLDELPAAVLARLPVRHDDRRDYFDDEFQAMPRDGYSALIARMLDHPGIAVSLSTPFDRGMEAGFAHCFLSLPIDTYFDLMHGPLPYRSLRFHHERRAAPPQSVPTLNFTDGGRFTRRTDWRLYPGHGWSDTALLTSEEPCAEHENQGERYYPVRTVDGAPQARYEAYRAEAARLERVTFIGRCGQYRYYDMHQVVANSRMLAARFLAGGAPPAQA
jgi:UDP-galactopyranose mutase